MSRLMKIFDLDEKAVGAIDGARVVEAYPAFVVAELDDHAVAALGALHALCADITDEYRVIVAGRDIDTSRPRIDATGKTHPHPYYGGAPALSPGPHHYLAQFIAPIKRSWLNKVRRDGGEIVAYQGDFVVIIRMASAAVRAVAALPFVRWLGHLPYSARVSPHVEGAKGGETPSPMTPRTQLLPATYSVQFFRADLAMAARAKVGRLGFDILEHAQHSTVMVLRAKASRASAMRPLSVRLKELSRVHGVRNISSQAIPRTSNDRAAIVMGAASALGPVSAAAVGLGLSGDGETVAICDTGLDTGDPAAIHPDFAERIEAIRSYPIAPRYASLVTNPGADDGPADLDSGHGTHTCGSILGNGTASLGLPGLNVPVRGLAYKARLVFQAVEQQMNWKDPSYNIKPGRYILSGLPSQIDLLFRWAYARGARIHSNSWGGGAPGAYSAQCEDVDRFVWSHPDFCILFAAGNDGADHNGDGVIDAGSVTPPGTAKNCITVGASENNRPEFTLTYGVAWPKDYPVPPISTDRLADNPDQVAAFSSRGPTADGRCKPDLVAPGTYILSTRSRVLAANQFGFGRFGSSSMYMFDCGTSMATPLVAGAVAVVREYLRKRAQISQPSAALLKAALIAGAVGIRPGEARPNNDDGFGRLNLDGILAPAAPLQARFIEGAGLATGGLSDTTVTVQLSGIALTVVLAYSDCPGARLVNNLNLVLTSPDGTHHLGNATPGSTTFDSINNVELVTVTAAAAGVWRLRVIGSNVARGPQPYALVLLGAIA